MIVRNVLVVLLGIPDPQNIPTKRTGDDDWEHPGWESIRKLRGKIDPTKKWPHLRGLDLDFCGAGIEGCAICQQFATLVRQLSFFTFCWNQGASLYLFFLTDFFWLLFFFQLVLLPNEKSTLPWPNKLPLKDVSWKMIHFLFGAKVKSLLVSGPRLHQQTPTQSALFHTHPWDLHYLWGRSPAT